MEPYLPMPVEYFKNQHDFIRLSESIGNNLNLIQGAGGNTSFKDGEVLWVKASGCWLRDAIKKNIFVPVNWRGVIKRLQNCEGDPVTPEIIQCDDVVNMRPSIETTLHALLPHKYVVHTHSINMMVTAILDNGKQQLFDLLDGMNWSWVPYSRPGVPLALAIQKASQSNPDIFVLANHGVIFGAESIAEVSQLLYELERRVERIARSYKVDTNIDKAKVLINNSDYRLSKYPIVQSLAFDKVAQTIASTRSLYPDHVVFLGNGPMTILKIDELHTYLQNKGDNYDNVIIVEDLGVFVLQTLSEGAEAMLHCLTNVLLRIQPEDRLRYLTIQEESELIVWDAEKYRQKIQQ